jgi:hypothetical protein
MGALLPGDPQAYNVGTISTVMANIITIVLTISAGIAVIYIIIGAISYLTAYGNEEKATQGKKTITWAIIGLVVIISAELIITTIWHFITGNNPTFPF